MTKATIHVAIALLFHQNQVLVGWREAKQHQGNKYEFPGGKVEQGELPVEACRREVIEEVGVDIERWHASDFISHEYEDLIVNLHIFHASVQPEQLAEIKQPWRWYPREELGQLNFPKANQSMIQKLQWPQRIKIAEDIDILSSLDTDQMLYWRVQATPERIMQLQQYPVDQLSKLIINQQLWSQLNELQQQTIRTIHLKQNQLMNLKQGELKSGYRYLAACHDLTALMHAEQIGCEAALLSSVLTTATHPDTPALGWERFKQMAEQVQIPVFALGGMKADELDYAKSQHAYGIAGIRYI
ncbi:NUDIX domain-containing protein [Acinetobacter sp.]|uniref:NUDIX domain-containing protein n=1 Tax=Acinetobacter sp. TaxID=472 RepID=UPI003BAFCC62